MARGVEGFDDPDLVRIVGSPIFSRNLKGLPPIRNLETISGGFGSLCVLQGRSS